MSAIKYRPEIDGLRAIAVIPVILFHTGFNLLPGGFIGVDVFFVISGFLITSIIKKDLEDGSFTFSNFWARRIRRILPALIFVTACTLLATFLFVFPAEQQSIGKQAIAALFSFANIHMWLSTGDYWGIAAEQSPFLHAWSLSVEEQFYILFPIGMWFIFRYKREWIKAGIAITTLFSLGLFLWGSQNYPTATFYLLPTRAWEIGAGCLLAVSITGLKANYFISTVLSVTGFAMVLISYLAFTTLSEGLLLAVAGTLLIISFGQIGPCKQLLSSRPLVHIGKISYSLYLWHWPLIVLAEPIGIDWPGFTDKVLLLIMIYAFAYISYHCIEKPTRRRKGAVPWILTSGIIVTIAAALMPGPKETDDFNTPTFYLSRYSLQPGELSTFGANKKDWRNPERNTPNTAYREGGVIVGPEIGSPRIVVLGDSVGVMWSNTIREIVERIGVKTSLYSAAGATPFVQIPIPVDSNRTLGFRSHIERSEFDHARLGYIEEWQPDLVILCPAWSRTHKDE
ncbi:MAG: acyltransferase, partial [Planctomycetota bacterium]|nr:acyltransferase [Planctomycetota bacterium]